MEILSENIKKYLINNLHISDENDIELDDIYKVGKINLNRQNYSLKEAKFVPSELALFKNLKECAFSQFLINDEIKENLSKLENLEVLDLDHCIIAGCKTISNKIKVIIMNYSNFNFMNIFENKSSMKKILLKDIINVDIKKITEFENIEELILLNCEIKNSIFIKELKNLKKVRIIGCKLDNDDAVNMLDKNIEKVFSKDEFFYVE